MGKDKKLEKMLENVDKNLHLSDIMSSVIQKINDEISKSELEMDACRKYDAYKEGDIQEGKIEGLKFCLELLKHFYI